MFPVELLEEAPARSSYEIYPSFSARRPSSKPDVAGKTTHEVAARIVAVERRRERV
jgi:hypothetical protein